nr:RNA-directed DNA polymerase, eukaryota, reverse transcriptase zinc-binding domain protein [Tanacetum cinerariifolium]
MRVFEQVMKKFNRGLVIGSHRNLDAKQSEGILVEKSKQRWYYRAKTTNVREDVGTSNQNAKTSKKLNDNATTTSNSLNKYDALDGIDENIEHVESHLNNEEHIEDVEANMDETALFMTGRKVTVAASTPNHKNCYAVFKPYRISDHCPAVLKIPQKEKMKPKPFKFSNYIVHKDDFKAIIEEGWANTILGHKMFRVVKKLRLLKKPLRKLMWSRGNLHVQVKNLWAELDEA